MGFQVLNEKNYSNYKEHLSYMGDYANTLTEALSIVSKKVEKETGQRPPYLRFWGDKITTIDYGSHTSFFYAIPNE